MAAREVLQDGLVRLADGRCTFVYRRLRPGALLITISGADAGAFVAESLDEVSAEIARQGALDLYLDLSGATGVAPEVSDAWTAWFRTNRSHLRRVTMLATSKIFYVLASMMRTLSGIEDRVRIHTDAAAFEQELAREAPGPTRPSATARGEPGAPSPDGGAAQRPTVRREVMKDGTVRLSAPSCAFAYRRLRPGALLVSISGHDKGDLGTAPLDEVSAEIARFGPIDLFVDTAAATGIATPVSDLWTAWFRDNKPRLKRVSVHAPSRFVRLVISVAKLFSGTGELIRIYDEAEPFDQAIAREAPGFVRPPGRG